MSKGVSDRKKEASAKFADMFDGSEEKPTPEEVVVKVMHGAGDNKITDRMLEAAKVLLPYRLPKLNNVEAHVATEDMTHEEWIESLSSEEYDDEDET